MKNEPNGKTDEEEGQEFGERDFLQLIGAPFLIVNTVQFHRKLHRDFPLVWGYNGHDPGSRFEARRGLHTAVSAFCLANSQVFSSTTTRSS